MPDGGDKGNFGIRGSAHDDLFIELPEVFQTATAAGDYQHIGARYIAVRLKRVKAVYRGGYLRCGTITLNRDRPHQDVTRKPVVEPMKNIADHSPGRRRYDTNHVRQEWQFLLSVGIEQSFCRQLLAPVFQQLQQRAFARQFNRFNDDLITRAFRV